jgi:hypothetical protein
VATGLFAVWAFCLMAQTFLVKLELIFESTLAVFGMIVLVSFMVLCIQPFHFCYKKARVAVI